MTDEGSVRVEYAIDIFPEQADLSDPIEVARAAHQLMVAPDGLLPILTVHMPGGSVDVDLQVEGDVGPTDDRGEPIGGLTDEPGKITKLTGYNSVSHPGGGSATGTPQALKVFWHVAGMDDPLVTTVLLIEGYSTEADIPKIIAARDRSLTPDVVAVDQTIPISGVGRRGE